jgi:hypothetical protein
MPKEFLLYGAKLIKMTLKDYLAKMVLGTVQKYVFLTNQK